MKALRHFLNFENGPEAMARIDFSDLTEEGFSVLVTIEMSVDLNSWMELTDKVKGILELKARQQMKDHHAS